MSTTLHKLAIATVHPSWVLRQQDPEAAYAGFLQDLRLALQ
jgi:hypothetical protein